MAILQAAKKQDLPLLPVKNSYTEPGLGVKAEINGLQVLVGNLKWIGDTRTESIQEDELATSGKTVVYVSINSKMEEDLASTLKSSQTSLMF